MHRVGDKNVGLNIWWSVQSDGRRRKRRRTQYDQFGCVPGASLRFVCAVRVCGHNVKVLQRVVCNYAIVNYLPLDFRPLVRADCSRLR